VFAVNLIIIENNLNLNIKIIIRLHDSICMKNTGRPIYFCQKLGISIRTLYEYISFMKYELHAPIIYDRNIQSYVYYMDCSLQFIEKTKHIKNN
jgi:hypothetical protein